MAYQPYTSTSPNTPILMDSQPIAGNRIWLYKSTHTQSEVGTSDFVSDGLALGMKPGDPLIVLGSTTYVRSEHSVRAVGSTFTTISAGLCISSAS